MRIERSRASSITVLAYHRVEPSGDNGLAPGLVEAAPEQFEAQMRYMTSRYTVVSPFDLARALRGGYTLPNRAMAITFDDGYRSFKEVAMPVLRRLGLPVGLFVVTGHASRPERPFWWDELYRVLTRTHVNRIEVPVLGEMPLGTRPQREEAYDRIVAQVERLEAGSAAALVSSVVAASGVEPAVERVTLDWEELQVLAEEGVAIGPHTRTHPILSRVSNSELRAEIAGSWHDLHEKVPGALPIFCYPNGKPHALTPAVAQVVRGEGLLGGFTMVAGQNVLGRTDPYFLHRVGLEPGESLQRLALKLTPAGRLYRALKRTLARPGAGGSGR